MPRTWPANSTGLVNSLRCCCKLVVLCTVLSQHSLGSGGVAQRLEAHTIAQ